MDPRTRRLLVRAVGLLIVFNLAILTIDSLINDRQVAGPSASSFVTTGEGTGAWYELLERAGHPVSRLTEQMLPGDLSPLGTLVILEPFPGELTPQQLLEVSRFVSAGGRLIAGGAFPEWIGDIVDSPSWNPLGAATAEPTGNAPETGYVSRVEGQGIGSWTDLPPDAQPLLQAGDGTVTVTSIQVDAGRVILLADPTMLFNNRLDDADNAAFALGIAGESGKPIVFNEYIHGYQTGQGFSVLPSNWIWAFFLGLAALVVYLIAIGRRLGPPQDAQRPLPPARGEYLDAVATSLAKTRQPAAATAPIRNAARRLVARRSTLPPGASAEDVAVAAEALGLTSEEVAAISRTPVDEAEFLASGRALAKLSRSEPSDRPPSA